MWYYCNRSPGLLFSDVLLQYIIRTVSDRNMNFRHGPILYVLFEDTLKENQSGVQELALELEKFSRALKR